MRILIVNNTPSFLTKFNSHLHNPNYQIKIVPSSDEGLQYLRKVSTDVVISNLGKNATVDNLEFMLYTKEINPKLPVILVIHQIEETNSHSMIQAGAYACIDESTSGDELIQLAQRAIKERIYVQ